MTPEEKLQHRLNNHLTVMAIARAVLEEKHSSEEQRQRARLRLTAAAVAARKVEEQLGIQRNEA